MDQGVIQNLKVHYRRFLLRERIKAIDDAREIVLMNLLGALHILRRAWDEVRPETVANCFRHAKFVISLEVEEEATAEGDGDDGIDELLDAWGDLKLIGGIETKAQSAFNLVRRYVEQNYADPAILKYSDASDEAFYQERRKKEKQSQITDFFSNVN